MMEQLLPEGATLTRPVYSADGPHTLMNESLVVGLNY